MSITLSPEFEAFVHTRVASGAYASEQEVLRTAFELLDKRDRLRAHIDEGARQIESGQFAEYGDGDREKFIASIRTMASRTHGFGTSQ
jgi:putative addiction module CopG family antidote